MTPESGPARRFLHVCYSCGDNAAATSFFVDGLAMRHTMSSPTKQRSSDLLGLDRPVTSGADFVYDARGPRTSPAIEIQGWVDPPVAGTPFDDPTAVGFQAVGFAVRDLDAAVSRLTGLGCTTTGSGPSPFAARCASLRDLAGVTIDLVEDAAVPVGRSRLRHARITVSDLAKSVAWYEGVGFEVTGSGIVDDGSFVGHTGRVAADAVWLRLPDEPFAAVLVQWSTPRSHGRHYREPNHAGLYRAALCVDDTRASYAAMSTAGWSFERPPISVELPGTPVPDMWICFLNDPDGVAYEFIERPRMAFRPEQGAE